jgi:hypothetical protein
MYTITSGIKNKFFTDKYMPIVYDQFVTGAAVNGRLDVIRILNSGSGYFGGGNVNNYSIVTVTGDGTGASVSANVALGKITSINIISGGVGYSNVYVSTSDPLQLGTGTKASLFGVIGPSGGNGNDPARELGASDLMISTDFIGNVGGFYPVQNDGTDNFRQISLVQDPTYTANGNLAVQTTYSMFTSVYVSQPSIPFTEGGVAYVGATYDTATFKARIVHFDTTQNLLLLNNIEGDVTSLPSATIYQYNSPSIYTYAKVYLVTQPDINILSGQVLYVENRDKITRSPTQTESVKLVLEF